MEGYRILIKPLIIIIFLTIGNLAPVLAPVGPVYSIAPFSHGDPGRQTVQQAQKVQLVRWVRCFLDAIKAGAPLIIILTIIGFESSSKL